MLLAIWAVGFALTCCCSRGKRDLGGEYATPDGMYADTAVSTLLFMAFWPIVWLLAIVMFAAAGGDKEKPQRWLDEFSEWLDVQADKVTPEL